MTTLLSLTIALPLIGALILLMGGRATDAWGHLLGCAAVIGLALVKTLGVTPAAAFLAVLATLALLKLARLPLPPALGLALLPFVIPQPPLSYPLFTLAGSLWLVLVVAAQEAWVKRYTKNTRPTQ